MISIHSGVNDSTSKQVYDYLQFLSQDSSELIFGDGDNYTLKVEIDGDLQNVEIFNESGSNIKIHEKSGWLRRGILTFSLAQSGVFAITEVEDHISREINILREFFYNYGLGLGSFQKEKYNNRIHNFFIAKRNNLKVPATLVTSLKVDLQEFVRKHEKVITKPIHNGHLSFNHDNLRYTCKGTQILTEEFIGGLEERFYPSLFQEYIDKKVEIRVFVLAGKVYPMAIFSQLDPQTQYDFRNYNRQKPNRAVPFTLPAEVVESIVGFMRESDLDTGSIDLILDKKNNYYFLEVNPTGQFGWVSDECNYYLEKKVANYLIETVNA